MKVFILSYSVGYLPGNVESNKPIHFTTKQVPITLQRYIIFILTFVNQKNLFQRVEPSIILGLELATSESREDKM